MKHLSSIFAMLALITLAVMAKPALAETQEEAFENTELNEQAVISEEDKNALYREAVLDLAYGDAPSSKIKIVVVIVVGKKVVVVIGGPKKPKPIIIKEPK
jgi:hypothetical protein